MPSILFVCTGNIFRSLTAEYALKAVLDPRSPIRVSSAGTVAIPRRCFMTSAMDGQRRCWMSGRRFPPGKRTSTRLDTMLSM
ncbi:MAG TPA: hypothetical protein VLK82_21270 [Candidatus Tectomicrobia bacterium]|nr:hypothetical protein [Candidatus Tectomicrobia bacterium]